MNHIFSATKRNILRRSCMVRAAMYAVLLLAGVSARAQLKSSQVLVLVNKDTQISSEVAQMYQKLRGIPASNLLSLSLGKNREITREQYRTQIAAPVKKILEANQEIRCILTTSGVPYTIQAPANEGAALDNELATVLRDEPKSGAARQPNPLFLYGTNPFGMTDPRKLKMVYVARLDGPDLKTITRMAEDAVATEKSGLQGPVYGDARGLETSVGYGEADASIRVAIDRFSGAGFQSKLDLNEETWTQPKGSVGDQAAGAAFYVGWYKLRDFQDIFGPQGLARGAIAWHVASGEAVNLWDANEKGWCVNLLRRGAAVTLGPVREPYVTAFPRGDLFVETLLAGATIAESYWLSLPDVSWDMVLLGDPLYRPFALNPKPSLVARAYIAADANHILEKGQTRALLIRVECIGPVGASTPTLSAVAEPGMGLAAASGSVTIPPLRAGQSTAVRVPSVTAGNDPNGIFRLNLKVQNVDDRFRNIVLEGRIGFSRLTGGLLPAAQMVVSPNAEYIVSGQPGNTVLTDTGTLRSHPVTLRPPIIVAGAEFAPNSAHVALALLDTQQKKTGFVITDQNLTNGRSLPAGFKFVRWLTGNQILLQGPNGFVSQDVQGLTTRPFETPAGWSTASVIPGTDIQILFQQGGKVAFKNPSEPLHPVLPGIQAVRFIAIANDLSMFGAVDGERRLWVQRGLPESPQMIAAPVEQVLWGPISRRALVKDANGRSRVYDGRDNSWIDLDTVTAAEWSPNEERMLFTQSEDKGDPSHQYLSILNGRKISHLCSLDRLGNVGRVAFSENGQRAFLLAGLAGRLDVWEISLSSQPAPEPIISPERPERHFIIGH